MSNQNNEYYNQTTQPSPTQQPVTPQQMPQPTPQPAPKHSPTSGEMFVGLNVLSKVGVVFIIIGFIALAAVSEDYLPAFVRMLMIYALGGVMAVLGEVFFRKKSKIFARALTLGALFDWFVIVPVSAFSFECMNPLAAALAGAAAAAAGILLALRYNSQTIMISTVLCSVLPFIPAADDISGIYAGLAAVVCVIVASVVIGENKKWAGVVWTTLFYTMVLTVCTRIALSDIYRSDATESIIASVFTIIGYGVFIGAAFIKAWKNGGALTASGKGMLISSVVLSALTSMIFMGGISGVASGTLLMVLAVVYAAAAVSAWLRYGNCDLQKYLECFVLIFLPVSFIFLFAIRIYIIAILLYGAALTLFGLYTDKKHYKIWGITALGFSEILFLTAGVSHSELPIFTLQFGLNAAVFVAIMVCYALRGKRNAPFPAYCAAAIINAGFFGIFLIVDKLMPVISRAAELSGEESDFFEIIFSTVLWMALGFAVGKFRFMGKGAPITSICIYFFGLICLTAANIYSGFIQHEGFLTAAAIILVNVVSVACVLDIVKRAESLANKTMQSLALLVSAYALFTLTVVLGTNGWVAFTSCIISIIYIAVAVFWIAWGFARSKPLTRRFGLALTLLASAKLFLFDFSEINEMGRTLMFIGFGITLLAISFVYGFFEMKAKENANNK